MQRSCAGHPQAIQAEAGSSRLLLQILWLIARELSGLEGSVGWQGDSVRSRLAGTRVGGAVSFSSKLWPRSSNGTPVGSYTGVLATRGWPLSSPGRRTIRKAPKRRLTASAHSGCQMSQVRDVTRCPCARTVVNMSFGAILGRRAERRAPCLYKGHRRAVEMPTDD